MTYEGQTASAMRMDEMHDDLIRNEVIFFKVLKELELLEKK